MKAKFFLTLTAVICTLNVFAQVKNNSTIQKQQINDGGDFFKGMTRGIPTGRVVIPYGISVTFDKTVHLIFPSAIKYVDLGSQNIIAGEAEDATNVLRVKAAVENFETETNMSVICEDGSFYAFNVKYANEPENLSIEMKDFLDPGGNNLPSNRADIYFKELGSESPVLVRLISKTIHHDNKNIFKHLGLRKFGLTMRLKSIYSHNGLLYFNVDIDNRTHIPFIIDNVTFRIADKKLQKRTAIQEKNLPVIRAYNYVSEVRGRQNEHMIFTLEQFSIPNDKILQIIAYEKGGARTLTLPVNNEDILHACSIQDFKLKF